MNIFGIIFKNTVSRVWAIVSIVLAVLLIVVTVLSCAVFYDLFETVLGGRRPVLASGITPLYTASEGCESKAAVFDAANDLNEKVCEEGFVLLKNKDDALPLARGAKVSVFGKNSVDLSYGGSGSGSGDSDSARTIYDSLEAAGFDCNPVLKEFYEDESLSGEKRKANSADLDSGDTVILSTAETPQTMYTKEVKSSYADYSDAAIIVITRIGGEGFDLPRTMKGATGAGSEDDHFLELDKNEKELIIAAENSGFDKIVVVINAGNAMELAPLENDANIDAVINMGFPGTTGVMALGRILNGEVNPSGRTVDTYATDFTLDPTWNNFGDNRVTAVAGNADTQVIGGDQYYTVDAAGNKTARQYYFVDYEESVYVGYKYYETRAAYEGEGWYEDNVVYPFGYGLSYTEFTWKITDWGALDGGAFDKTAKYTVTVDVTNTGDVAGKEVVQLYAHAPYTEDRIEKAEKTFMDVAKTDILEPGDTDTVTLTFDPYYLASYDAYDDNGNGFSGWELDEGEYSLIVAHNAHDEFDSLDFEITGEGDLGSVIYDKDPVTGTEVVNRYTMQENAAFDSDTHLSTRLERWDWEFTWPDSPTIEERALNAAQVNELEDVTPNAPAPEGETAMPVTGKDVTIRLRDMLTMDENGGYVLADGDDYVSYGDERWDVLLDQLTYAELSALFEYGGFKTDAIERIGKPLTNDTDGPAGFVNFMDNSGTYWGACFWCSETVRGATFDLALMEEVGEMIGNEGIAGAADRGNGLPYSGWYAPGVNIHRSPFGGRNFEYFSEDGILSGKLAAALVRGCQSKGVYCYVKHFALNEQETHRSINGDLTWVTEQAMREIFLRPFEIAVKEGGTRAIMSSFNRIGTRWTGGDYRLLTEILRNEWGFEGMVISDFNTCEHMDTRLMAYAGGDINLVKVAPEAWSDPASAEDVSVLRRAAKNVLYAVVNSNAMNYEIIGYKMPVWQALLIAADCVVAVGIAVWGFFAVRKAVKTSKRKDEKRQNDDDGV